MAFFILFIKLWQTFCSDIHCFHICPPIDCFIICVTNYCPPIDGFIICVTNYCPPIDCFIISSTFMCTSRCFFMLLLWANPRPQISHLYGFSPVCILSWTTSFVFVGSPFPQYWQLYVLDFWMIPYSISWLLKPAKIQ